MQEEAVSLDLTQITLDELSLGHSRRTPWVGPEGLVPK